MVAPDPHAEDPTGPRRTRSKGCTFVGARPTSGIGARRRILHGRTYWACPPLRVDRPERRVQALLRRGVRRRPSLELAQVFRRDGIWLPPTACRRGSRSAGLRWSQRALRLNRCEARFDLIACQRPHRHHTVALPHCLVAPLRQASPWVSV